MQPAEVPTAPRAALRPAYGGFLGSLAKQHVERRGGRGLRGLAVLLAVGALAYGAGHAVGWTGPAALTGHLAKATAAAATQASAPQTSAQQAAAPPSGSAPPSAAASPSGAARAPAPAQTAPAPAASSTSLAQANPAEVASRRPAEERGALRSANKGETASPSATLRGATARGARAKAPKAAPAWRALAVQGAFAEALALAEELGFEQECQKATARDLFTLAEAARLAGRPPQAQEAYSQLRRRFPRDPRAAAAAFMLGRVAQEERNDAAEAAGWFGMALREQPSGALAREALGRLMQARQKAGDGDGATEAAREYLERYPDGPRAASARALAKAAP